MKSHYKILLASLALLVLCHCATKNGEQGYYYRLGDMVKGKEFRDSSDGREYHYKYFPDSIATEYMKKTDEDNRYDILIDIVKRRTNAQNTPPSDMLLIHLRLGDVMDRTPYMAKEFLERTIYYQGWNYVKPLTYYQDIVAKIKDKGINSITLIGGFHHPLKSKNTSLEYVRLLGEYFESQGFKVTQRLDYDADDDFIYMCNASFFTPGGGGFSNIIKTIVLQRGKTIILP